MAWTEEWQPQLNTDKCKSIHYGHNNPKRKYLMDKEGTHLELHQDSKEKDLGITFQDNLKFDQHNANNVKKTNRLLGMIRRTFTNLNRNIFLQLYKSLIRPHLEYAVSVWHPFLKKEIIQIENVQRRASKLVLGLQNHSYSERLISLGLPSLEYRRKRYDVIQVYRILSGKLLIRTFES
ncbi:hypothetical protein SNE40_005932 [Patella caerulea]|uniref:Uncharacterized protein n=1 Tax=Patella caerulea TaxID=87958 RepID=A0AAN8QAL4_PATCE